MLQKCITLLQNCTSSLPKLKQIHAFSIRHGVHPSDTDLAKHLIFAAVSLSSPMPYPLSVFSQLQTQNNIFIFNTIIRGFAESSNPSPVLRFYAGMRRSCVKPDTHTYPFLLKALSRLTNVTEGEKLHCVVVRSGFESLVFVRNGLISLYFSFGMVDSAYKVFEEMTERDLVAWNSVVNGFAMNGRPNEALTVFKEMDSEGVGPDGFTMVSLLGVCAEIGALALGGRVHVYMVKTGLVRNAHAANALLDMYAKCGSIGEARRVFEEMEERSVVSWTALVVGLAVNGFGKEALKVFKEFKGEGMVPTMITFVGVLYACSHCGMVNEGFEYFRVMKEEYGIVPRIEHYGCMVDLLARAGKVKEAYEYIKAMPVEPNAVIWRTLLGACTIHGYSTLGDIARGHILRLEPGNSGDYVLISNLYASEHRWSDVQKVRRKMLNEGVKKTPGYSIVELKNKVFEFTMGDRSHPLSDEIYAKLSEIAKMLRMEGYVPHIENVFADIEEEEKENALSYHSEKIAIAFMLLSTAPGTPIRIWKNLRVCADCHYAFKLISGVYDRTIVVRDRSRFHHFRDGSCSCSDYW